MPLFKHYFDVKSKPYLPLARTKRIMQVYGRCQAVKADNSDFQV